MPILQVTGLLKLLLVVTSPCAPAQGMHWPQSSCLTNTKRLRLFLQMLPLHKCTAAD